MIWSNELKNCYIGSKAVKEIYLGSEKIRPSIKEVYYDFTISNQWFSTWYTNDGWVSQKYVSGSWLWWYINWSLTGDRMAYRPFPSEIYDMWVAKKIEIMTSWNNGWGGIARNATWARWYPTHEACWGNWKYSYVLGTSGDPTRTNSWLSNFVGKVCVIDLENWKVYANWATYSRSFDKSTYTTLRNNKNLALSLNWYGWYNSYTYIKRAKFYF